jgi:hypothetical protein
MKHTKAARKASFRFHAHPASEAILRVLRAYKRIARWRRGETATFYRPTVAQGWEVIR